MCYLEVTVSTWAGGTALWDPGESSGRALPSSPYPFLQPFLTLSQTAFQKPVFSWSVNPGGLFLDLWEEAGWFHLPVHTCKAALKEAAPCSLGLGVPAEALTGSWHVPLSKPLLLQAQRDMDKIFQSSPEPLLPPKLIGLKTNPGFLIPYPFPAAVSTLWSCFLPLLIGLIAVC